MTQWNASDYAKRSSLQETMAQEQLSLLELTGAEHVLDVGCGDGKITAKVADRLPKGTVLGVDPSSQMVEYANKVHAADHPNRLSFRVGDARHLGFKNQFDLVISFNALHWVKEQDQPKSVVSIYESLKPGGQTLLRFVGQGERVSLEDVIQELCSTKDWKEYFPKNHDAPYCHPSLTQYEAWATAAGFRVENLTMGDKAWDFGSREGFVKFCEATFVEWARFLPEAKRAAFINGVLDKYALIAESKQVFKFYQMNAVLRRV